jgi:pimeloyl-ACP methyl ester carboxylesterase
MSSTEISAPARASILAPASQWTTLINLRSYHYVTSGPEDAPALLFLHGFADSWRSAEGLISHLQHHFRIFALDQRGHGESDGDFGRFRVQDFAGDAVDFIETVIGRPVILVGHCLGGLAAQHVAFREPRLVERLVLIGSGDCAHGNGALAALQPATGISPARSIAWRKVAAAFLEDRSSVAHRITRATLLLWGEHDLVFDREAQARLRASLRQQKLIAYPEIGHAPHREAPERVARDILSFCWQ